MLSAETCLLMRLVYHCSWHWDVNERKKLYWLLQAKTEKQIGLLTMFWILYFPLPTFKSLPKDRQEFFFENHEYMLDLTKHNAALECLANLNYTVDVSHEKTFGSILLYLLNVVLMVLNHPSVLNINFSSELFI